MRNIYDSVYASLQDWSYLDLTLLAIEKLENLLIETSNNNGDDMSIKTNVAKAQMILISLITTLNNDVDGNLSVLTLKKAYIYLLKRMEIVKYGRELLPLIENVRMLRNALGKTSKCNDSCTNNSAETGGLSVNA